MEIQLHTTFSLYTFLYLLSLTTVFSSFSPTDHYLINCGSTKPITVDVDHRKFTADSPFLYTSKTITHGDSNPDPDLSPIYHTARVFTRPSNYKFGIKEKGTHLVRLHFNRFNFQNFDVLHAQFHVLANGYVLLHNFTVGNTHSSRVKDFMIWVDADELVITFMPSKRSIFAFINAIEVISAPKDLIADVAQFVSSEKNERIKGLMKNAYETVYRVNVGGLKVTPFNDSLWRTWVVDDDFLNLSNGTRKEYVRAHFGGRVKYQLGGATHEVAPDNVYNTARVISSSNNLIPNLNLTWVFPVPEGFKYIVRMHFCDIASVSLGKIYFNVYINGNLAYENLDLTYMTNEMLASPFYADFVVDEESLGVIRVDVGPSNTSMPNAIDAMLNGLEILKINNSMGSLDGNISVDSVSKNWPRGNMGFFVLLIAAVCLLLTASLVMQRRRTGNRDSVVWSQLPVDVSEVNLKCNNGKVSSEV